MNNRYKHAILWAIAGVITGATWLVVARQLLSGEMLKLLWFVFGPVSAAYVAASLPHGFGLPAICVKTFMAAVAVLGWYCPIALLAWKQCPMSKRQRTMCIVGTVLIWALPIVGFIASKSE